MEVRKIFKVGNSLVVSLPFRMIKGLGIRDGSHVAVEVNRETREIILKPVVVRSNDVSVEFARVVDKLLMEYEPMIRRLADDEISGA